MVELPGSPKSAEQNTDSALTADTDLAALLTAILGDSAVHTQFSGSAQREGSISDEVTSSPPNPDRAIADTAGHHDDLSLPAPTELLVGELRAQVMVGAPTTQAAESVPQFADSSSGEDGRASATVPHVDQPDGAMPATDRASRTQRHKGPAAASSKKRQAWVVSAPPDLADVQQTLTGKGLNSSVAAAQQPRELRESPRSDGRPTEPDLSALDGRIAGFESRATGDGLQASASAWLQTTDEEGAARSGIPFGSRTLTLVVAGVVLAVLLAWLAMRAPAGASPAVAPPPAAAVESTTDRAAARATEGPGSQPVAASAAEGSAGYAAKSAAIDSTSVEAEPSATETLSAVVSTNSARSEVGRRDQSAATSTATAAPRNSAARVGGRRNEPPALAGNAAVSRVGSREASPAATSLIAQSTAPPAPGGAAIAGLRGDVDAEQPTSASVVRPTLARATDSSVPSAAGDSPLGNAPGVSAPPALPSAPVTGPPPPPPPPAAATTSTPARIMNRAQPIVRGEALGSATVGTVTVRVFVDAAGKVTAARSVSGPSLLRDSAEDAARRSQFEPAVENGASVASEVTVVYTFTRPANDVRRRGR